MQVLLTNSLFFHQKYGGVSRYATSLIKALVNENVDTKIISPLYKNNHLKNLKDIKKYGIYLPKYPNLKILEYLNTFLTNYYLKKNFSTDLIHNLYYPEKNIIYKKKNILTIHDTIHEKYSHLYSHNYFDKRKKFIENSNVIICVSQNTKKDIIELYKVPEKKIFVTPLGYDHLNNIDTLDIEKNPFYEKPFILYVGGRYKYKNFEMIVEAFSKSKKINENFNLICYGGEKVSDTEWKYFKDLGVDKKVIELRGDDRLLKSLYLKTKLLVSTSSYEGFGLNILEGLSLKSPILANKIKVFEDIFKDSINYYEYNNLDSLIYNLENILHKNIYNINRSTMENILEINNWNSCGKKTLEIYNLVN